MSMIGLVSFVLLGLALAGGFVRLVRGPGFADRAVALDLISVVAVGITIVFDLELYQGFFVDAATVVALVGFAGTIALAKWLEEGGHRE